MILATSSPGTAPTRSCQPRPSRCWESRGAESLARPRRDPCRPGPFATLTVVISWATILYGGGLTFAVVALVIWFAARGEITTVVVAASASTVGAIAWNAILHSISDANGFFVDAPIAIFPASWQDT